MHLYDPSTPLGSEEWILTVDNVFHTMTTFVCVTNTNTIYELKCCLDAIYHADSMEMWIYVHPDYPYPLSDSLLLGNLLEEHRRLILCIHENPSKVIPRRVLHTDMTDCVTGKSLGSPYQLHVLDFRSVYPEDVSFLRSWIQRSVHVHRVDLDIHHPSFTTICKTCLFTMTSGMTLWLRSTAAVDEPLENELIHLLRAYYKKHNGHDAPVRIVVDPGVLRNHTDHCIVLTPDHMVRVDLITAQWMGKASD